MGGLALLVFNRNDPVGTARVVRENSPYADEILVVDSSEPPGFEALERALQETPTALLRALPLGCTEPLRPLAHAHLRSEFVLSIDADENSTASLRHSLPGLRHADGYLLRRLEATIGAVTDVLRIYRRESIRYQGWIHEVPRVVGTVEPPDPEPALIHHADYRGYLKRSDRRREYLLIEALERPPTGRRLREEFPGVISAHFLPEGDRPVGASAARLLAAAMWARPPTGPGSLAGRLRNRRYFGHYVLERCRSFGRLSESERAEAIAIAEETRRAGGPIPYLGFDRPEYVTRLTQTFRWGRGGSETLADLLRFRFRSGQPRPDWLEPLPEPRRQPT